VYKYITYERKLGLEQFSYHNIKWLENTKREGGIEEKGRTREEKREARARNLKESENSWKSYLNLILII